jgi:RNA polymerase primary sigma factor
VSIVGGVVSQIERIQEKILASYQRSIPKIVREFAQSDLDAEDLLQVGRFGLLHAISAYDYRMSTSFSRFSKYWIRQRIQGYRKESGGPMVSLPTMTWDNYRKIRKAENELNKLDNFEPTQQEIADHLGWEVEKVDATMEEIATVQLANIDDDIYSENEHLEREAVIADTQEEDWKQAEVNAEQIEDVIDNLDPEDRKLICLRYGLVDHMRNDNLDEKEVFWELIRQLGCKTLLHRYLAGKLDTIQSLPVTPQEED